MPQQLYQLLTQLHAAANPAIIGPLKFLADYTESFLLHQVMRSHTSLLMHLTPALPQDNANACVAGFGPFLLQVVTSDCSSMQVALDPDHRLRFSFAPRDTSYRLVLLRFISCEYWSRTLKRRWTAAPNTCTSSN
jgi:hypothetical protein